MADDKSSAYIKAKMAAASGNPANGTPADTRPASHDQSSIVNRQSSIYYSLALLQLKSYISKYANNLKKKSY